MILISATFSAELLKPHFDFFIKHLNLNEKVVFAPYNQIFQQLFEPASLLRKNQNGINILLVRLDDLIQKTDGVLDFTAIHNDITNLLTAIQSLSSSVPFIFCLCPSNEASLKQPELIALYSELEVRIQGEICQKKNIYFIPHQEINHYYQVQNYYDAHTDEIGHIPYTEDYFCAMGTFIARKIHAICRAPYKVIVLDCDNTLWKGVCGEVGYKRIEIGRSQFCLQEFMVKQFASGMLICLCSKNNESDVLEVFNQRKEMLLKSEHIVASRINWVAKSQNLKEMADELSLGLDSFIFIDDNPLECAEIQARFPEVLCLTLPANEQHIPEFLQHVWAFDHINVTHEDKNRTLLYQQNNERNKLKQAVPTYAEFIIGLKLTIEVSLLQEEHITRVAQLTQRTNQFNFTTLRYTEQQLIQLLNTDTKCFVINVSDRFGDYGLVGALFYQQSNQTLEVLNFLLSCRVLGKGVEHHLLAKVGEIALKKNISTIRLSFVSSGKNQPALNFLESIVDAKKDTLHDKTRYFISADEASQIQYRPTEPLIRIEQNDILSASTTRDYHPFLIDIAQHYRTTKDILSHVFPKKIRLNIHGNPSAQNSIESKLVSLWEEVLKISPITINDNFFELGGDSFLATLILSRIWQTFNHKLSITEFLGAATIVKLAKCITFNNESVAQSTLVPLSNDLRYQPLPLSYAQERLWFLQQLDPQSSLYNMFIALKLTGELDKNALEKAFLSLIERHESLRTYFILDNGTPQQVVAPITSINFTLRQKQVFKSTDETLYQQAKEDAHTAFDLNQAPLMRVSLLQTTKQSSLLFICLHHIIHDGWSFSILCKELRQLYSAYRSQHENPLLPQTIQYTDFTIWQQRWLKNDILEQQLAYWRKQLAELPALNLPVKYAAECESDYQGQRLAFVIEPEITAKLKMLSQQSDATLYVTLLAAFAVLLARYSTQDDIVIGSPIAGRHYPGIENTLGFFVNLIILRLKLADNPTFIELLQQAKLIAEEAYAHQDVPFEKLVAALRPERSGSINPLIQILFAFQNFSPSDLTFPEVKIERVFSDNESLLLADFDSTKFDLSLYMQEISDSLHGLIEYNTTLFEKDTIQNLIKHFKTLLISITENPKQAIFQMPLMAKQELQQILLEWNNTQTPYPHNKTIHQLFEEQVEKHPKKIAVTFKEQSLTYQQLNERANQLAHYLRGAGVKKDAIVAVCLKQSHEMITALLGILKSGGAYVPIDENYPRDSIVHILMDCDPLVILTDEVGANIFLEAQSKKINAKLILIDGLMQEVTSKNCVNLININTADNLAYIIYTSGTTGKPKGAMLTHQGVNRLVKNTNYIKILSSDCIAQASSPLFDASIFEIWGALLNGARLVMFEKDIILSTQRFVTALQENKITILWLTSSLFNIIAAENPESFHFLNYLLIGGEPLKTALVKRVLDSAKRPQHLINGYGPTECTTFSTCYTITKIPQSASSVPIGKPINNTQVYILDKFLNPVPVGVTGELYISGPGVARGYLHQDELTKSKFLLNPFRKTSRLYKTGDLVRWLLDGNIDYIGRVDCQVKIRGYRVELDEIEYQLLKHPKVCQAIVVITDKTEDKKIVAYVVLKDNTLTRKDLHSYLKKQMFHFMLPHAYICLEQIPLLPSGKIDKKALPELTIHNESNSLVLETNQTLKTIKQLTANLLYININEIKNDDNFFDLGGYSLLVIKFLSEIKAAFGVALMIRSIFDASTIEDISLLVESHLSNRLALPHTFDIKSSAITLKEGGAGKPLFLIHPAGGTIFCYLQLVKYLKLDKACIAIQDPTIDADHLLFTSIPDMAAYYVKLIKSIQPKGPYYLAGYSFGGMVAIEIAHQLLQLKQPVGFIGLFDTWAVSITEPVVRESLKKRILEQYKETKAKMIEQKVVDSKLWLDLNHHRMQDLGFNYLPPKLNVKITLFKAKELFHEFKILSEDTNYWAPFSDLPIKVCSVPGNHDTILTDPNVQVLAQKISSQLNSESNFSAINSEDNTLELIN